MTHTCNLHCQGRVHYEIAYYLNDIDEEECLKVAKNIYECYAGEGTVLHVKKLLEWSVEEAEVRIASHVGYHTDQRGRVFQGTANLRPQSAFGIWVELYPGVTLIHQEE